MAQGLQLCVLEGRYQQMKYLLKSGVDINLSDRTGRNALISAFFIPDAQKRRRMVYFLISYGADCFFVDPVTHRDILTWAASLNRDEEVQYILTVGAEGLDLKNADKPHGWTALHYATRWGNSDMVRNIVSVMKRYDLSIDVPDKRGITPFLLAYRLNFPGIAEIMEKEGNARPGQFDLLTFRTKTEWKEIGENEIKHKVRHFLDENRKIQGRVKTSQVHCGGFFENRNIYINRRRDLDYQPVEYRCSRTWDSLSQLLNLSNTDTSSNPTRFKTSVPSRSAINPKTKQSTIDALPNLMQTASDSMSMSYRKGIIPHRYEVPVAQKPRMTFKRLSTLAMILVTMKSIQAKHAKDGVRRTQSLPTQNLPQSFRHSRKLSDSKPTRTGRRLSFNPGQKRKVISSQPA